MHERDLVTIQDWGVSARLAQACYALGFYAFKTVLPLNLTAYYPVPERVVWFELPFAACILATLLVSGGLFLLRRRWPGLLAAWLSYLAMLAPNLGFLRFGEQIAADRYSYIAMMSAVVVLAAGLGRIWPAGLHAWPVAAVRTAASLGVLLVLILLSRYQSQTWRTSLSLWAHALNHGASRSFAAHTNLGLALFDLGRLGEAREELAEALRINPGFADAHNNLGLVLKAQGRLTEAGSEFAAALRLNPDSAEAHNNRGVLLKAPGSTRGGPGRVRRGPRIDPLSAHAHCNLGVLLASQGRVTAAREEFSTALWINPDYADAHNNLGVLLFQQGQLAEAGMELAEALRINPGSAEAHANKGVLLRRLGRLKEARREFSETLRINPSFADAHSKQESGRKAQARIEAAGAGRRNAQKQ